MALLILLVNKRRENSETNFLSQSSDDSDEYDRDWPLSEVNPFECCKKSLYFEQSDVPVLNTVFSAIHRKIKKHNDFHTATTRANFYGLVSDTAVNFVIYTVRVFK